ncbi:response regulator transcription factor [Entomobacter blattae]|uniref:Cell cycle response regulator CtrA n=1 Tax=Entomobacter blattae TaxID=2762277 RepID=A0A7H1NPH7_9PROT|nr:response regulator transcription factor [Entomobacter blattae]QNT77687.1 Cell cycle response regulator CtrA [Entomobacter blattae]
MRILLVEDDLAMQHSVSKALDLVGFVVECCSTNQEGLERIKYYDYDVIIVDLTEDTLGEDLIRKIRGCQIDSPIICLSSVDKAQIKVGVFAAGADDYLVKPFASVELVARVQAVLRRFHGFSESVLKVGDVHLNLNTKEAAIGDMPLHLTGKESAILELLMLRKGTVLSKETFLNHLYGGMDEPEIKIVDVFICKIRKKMQQVGLHNAITTLWGRGYMLREENAMRYPYKKRDAQQLSSSLSMEAD